MNIKHTVWFVPEAYKTAANNILKELGRGPDNYRRKAINPVTEETWWFTADEPGDEFLVMVEKAKAGYMGEEVKTVIDSVVMYSSAEPVSEEDPPKLSGVAHINFALEDMGLEAVPEGQE